jgi:hypothetical protein
MIKTRWRSLAFAGLLGALLAPAAPAQEEKPKAPAPAKPAGDDQAALVKKRDEKLALEFLKKADWITDYDKARAEAKKTGKMIFAYFTRSYAH